MDHVAESGTIIEIVRGGVYAGTIVVDSQKFIGFVADPNAGEVTVDGGTGPAFDPASTTYPALLMLLPDPAMCEG